jgi:hypothetical protein
MLFQAERQRKCARGALASAVAIAALQQKRHELTGFLEMGAGQLQLLASLAHRTPHTGHRTPHTAHRTRPA